jgi:signal transduction histidine kinase/CheY-like chemotaxis protein
MQREELLYETQQQAEELQAQQEELRVANEELEEQSRALRESQASLEAQQAELEQTNVQLEEHTQLLARQNHALSQAEQRLREQTEELARSNQYKSEFLANMSHELRTPLNSALILAKLLADNKGGNLTPEQVAYAQNIYSANNDLLELINDILDLSKVESGKAEPRFEEVEVRPLIEAVAQLFGPVAAEKGIPCSFDVDPDVAAHMITDAQRLRQILKNLLSNAIKFTDRGQVALTVHKAADDRIAFAVRDTGVGIAPDQQEIIFEPFRQADGSTHRKHGGTGLGLSISRELAGLLGGTLELQSALGKGSTFTLQLPVSAQQTSSAPAAATPAPAPAPARIETAANETPFIPDDRSNLSDARRVLLVVEDDPAFAKILLDLAHTLDFHCLVARTADEGFAMALEFRPAAIVLDIGLPDHTGLTVLDRLKHNSATRHIPVQVVSASDYTQTALAMGAAGYLIKPVAYEQLEEALAKLQSKVSARARTVLVVEDNAIQRDSICELLASQDVRTVAVDTAAAALQQLQQTSFDCMVLDLALPDASGYQLLETMAGQEQYSFPPVIVYTGRSLSPTQEQQLRRYSRSIIIKGARSPERLLDEVTLFLHQVETTLPSDRQRMLRVARDRESVLDGKRVLIVEDDVRNIFALSRVLEPCGLTLVIARNGLDALAVLNQQSVDLVLMDIMMPEMDGLEATRRIRAQAAFAKVPIIALTAKAMPDDQQRCLEAGANDYITKPIDVDKLLSLMRIWLN